MLEEEESAKPDNTEKSFTPKVVEYHQFCECAYPNSVAKCHLECDKIYRFMFYLSFREQKKRGKKEPNEIQFDSAAHDGVMSSFVEANGELTIWPNPKKPIGAATFSQCKAVLKLIHRHEAAARTTVANQWAGGKHAAD